MLTSNWEALHETSISANHRRSVGQYRGTKRTYEATDGAETREDKKHRLNPGTPSRYDAIQRQSNHQQPVDNRPKVQDISASNEAHGSNGYIAVQNTFSQPSGCLCSPAAATHSIVLSLPHTKSPAAPQGSRNLRQVRPPSALGGNRTSQYDYAIHGGNRRTYTAGYC